MASRRIAPRVAMLLGVASIAVAAGLPVRAQSVEGTTGFYAGAGAGTSVHALDERYYHDDRFHVPETDTRQSSPSRMAYVGYRANRHLAIEVALQDLGSTEHWHDRCPTGIPCPASEDFLPFQTRESRRRASLAFVVIQPLGERFEVFGKLGLSRDRRDVEILHDPGLDDMRGGHGYTTERLLSAGGNYLFNDDWALRLQWDRIDFPFRSVWFRGTTRVDAVTLAVEHRFD